MKTYRIYIRNAMTKFRWRFIGTTSANNEKEVLCKISKMYYKTGDSEYKFELQE